MERQKKFFCDLSLEFQGKSGTSTKNRFCLYTAIFLFNCLSNAIVFIKEIDNNNNPWLRVAQNYKCIYFELIFNLLFLWDY